MSLRGEVGNTQAARSERVSAGSRRNRDGNAARSARSITDPDREAETLTDLARTVAKDGDMYRAEALAGQAERAAQSITDRTSRHGRWRT